MNSSLSWPDVTNNLFLELFVLGFVHLLMRFYRR